MIDGAHVIMYSRDAEADRAFLRDILRSNSVDVVKPSAGFAAPALVKVEGDSNAPVVKLTSRLAGSDRVLYRARTRPVYGTYFSGWIQVPLGRATVCAESGGAGTEHNPSRACFNITTRHDLQKPSLSLAFLGAHLSVAAALG